MHWELCQRKGMNIKPPDVISFFVTYDLKFETYLKFEASLKRHKITAHFFKGRNLAPEGIGYR